MDTQPDNSPQDFIDKIVVITGGNSGIGLAAAQAFTRRGATLVLFGRDAQTLEEAGRSLGPDTLTVQGDVTQSSDLGRLFAAVRERFGRIDSLFVNAGMARMGAVATFSEADFDAVMNVNFKGAFFTVQGALPLMGPGGTIVLNTSINANIGMPGTSVYAASKAALISLARTLSADVLAQGIRVNAVSPGPVGTPFFGRLGMPEDTLQQFAENVQGQIPLGRFGTPDEIAQAVVFLASPASSFIVGTELVADGGMSQL